MFVDLDGQRLHVVSFGGGTRTLVAHGGWVGSWELWQQPFELLSSDWRCVSYDHRGTGESPASPDSITPEAMVADLFGVMDRLEIERCVVAGESLGAMVVLEAARRAPERFGGLVVVDGAPQVDEDAVAGLIAGARSDYRATIDAFVGACVPGEDAEHLRRWGRHLLMRSEPESAARLLECYLDPPAPAIPLEDITVRTLVIHSNDDAIVPVGVGEWVAASIADSTLVRLDGAGHVPTVTQPADVADAIRARFPA